MIALIYALILLLPVERIYPATFAPTDKLTEVVDNRGWQDTGQFDVLLGMPDCNLLARWAWVITQDGVKSGLVVDCSKDEHRAQMVEDGVIDVSRGVSGKGWVVIR